MSVTTGPLEAGSVEFVVDMPVVEPLDADAGHGDLVERAGINTGLIVHALEQLGAIGRSYAFALPESRRDRARLRADVDALLAQGAFLVEQTKALHLAVAAARARRTRLAPAVAVPAISALGGFAEVPVTWSDPWPDTDYDVFGCLEVPTALIGKVAVTTKTRTTTGAVLTVTSTAPLQLGAMTVRAFSVTRT